MVVVMVVGSKGRRMVDTALLASIWTCFDMVRVVFFFMINCSNVGS